MNSKIFIKWCLGLWQCLGAQRDNESFYICAVGLILNYSPMSNNLSAIFIEKERLKWYVPTGI